MEQNPIPLSPNPDFPIPISEKIPSKKGPTIFILSVVFFAMIIVAAAAGYWFYLKDKMEPVACTLEAKICPDGSSVGRSGPNCEFAPCPTPIPIEPNPAAASSSSLMQIPELGIKLTLPSDLLDLDYMIEDYENSTAALFTTKSLAAKFPKCEFPMGGLGWITRVKEPTATHNKKIGDYYFGIEQAKEACSRTAGSEIPDQLEVEQERLFMEMFSTATSL